MNHARKTKELLEYMAWHHEDRYQTMTVEQKEVFESFDNRRSEYARLAEEAILT